MVTNMGNDIFVKFLTATEKNPPVTHTVPGEGVQGDYYDEFHVDQDGLQDLIYSVFTKKINSRHAIIYKIYIKRRDDNEKTNKILAGILSAVVLMSPATTWAGPSITDKVVVVEDSVGKYIVTDKIEEDEVLPLWKLKIRKWQT